MAEERFGFVPTGSSGPTASSFASLNDLSRTLEGSSSLFDDENSKFPRSQPSAASGTGTTDHVFHPDWTSTASALPQQYKKPSAWYNQVYPIPYPGSSSTILKQEPLDDKWRCDQVEEESEDDNDDDDDGEDEIPSAKSIEAEEREKKRRRRNKPTLSCRECVGKKIRVRLIVPLPPFFVCHLSYDPGKEVTPL